MKIKSLTTWRAFFNVLRKGNGRNKVVTPKSYFCAQRLQFHGVIGETGTIQSDFEFSFHRTVDRKNLTSLCGVRAQKLEKYVGEVVIFTLRSRSNITKKNQFDSLL